MNGLIIQWKRVTYSSVRQKSFTETLPVNYSNTNTAVCFVSAISTTINSFGASAYLSNANTVKGILYGIYNTDLHTGLQIVTIGY